MKPMSMIPLYRGILLFALVFPLFSANVYAQDEETKTLTITTDSDDARRHFMQGMHDQDNVFFERARVHFAAAVAADPGFALAQLMHDTTVPGLNQAQRIAKLNESLNGITQASTAELLFATGIREQVAGNGANALALFAAAADLVPDDPHVATRHAGQVGAGGSPERIAATRNLTERFPDNAAAYNTLAYGLWGTGDKAGAREAVSKYVELEPNHPNSHDSYAELFQFSGMYGQAIKHYKKAIALDENYFAGYAGLSEALLLSGDADGARAALATGRQHAPNANAKANLTRAEANTYFQQGDGKMGLSTLKKAAKEIEAANPGGAPQVHRELAVAEALYGNKNNVAAHISKATELQTGSGTGTYAWATIAHSIVGNVDDARTAARGFEKASNGNSFTKTLDGIVLVAAGDYAAAEKTLLAAGLNNPWSKAFMARCQKEMGNTAEALSLEREIMSDNQFTANNFGYTLSRLTLVEGGAGHVRAGLELN